MTTESDRVMPMDVVIPAGGSIDGDFQQSAGTPLRALAPLGTASTPVLQVVIDSLRNSGVVRRIIAVGPEELQSHIEGVDLWIPGKSSGPENIMAGLAAGQRNDQTLVCTSDLPFLTPESVRTFVVAISRSVDIALGIVDAAAYEGRFPDAPPSQWVNMRDVGPVTISCLFMVRPSVLTRNAAIFTQAFAARKSQLRMASLLGPKLIWQLTTKSLRCNSLITRAEQILGCKTAVARSVPPELSFDIDTVEDYDYARTRVNR